MKKKVFAQFRSNCNDRRNETSTDSIKGQLCRNHFKGWDEVLQISMSWVKPVDSCKTREYIISNDDKLLTLDHKTGYQGEEE